MKTFHFLSGYSRAGNTFLSSLINQNPNVIFTANSGAVDIVWKLACSYKTNWFENFPDKKGLENVMNNFFENYYEHYNASIIFDRGGWGTPDNLSVLQTIIKEPKFLLLVRPLNEVLASYVKVAKPIDVTSFVNELMHPDGGKIYWDWLSTKNIIEKYKKNYLIVNYASLIENPKKSIDRIYDFFKIPVFSHDFNNIKPLEINGVKYDDNVFKINLHDIRPFISKEEYAINDYLPQDIINMYKNWDLF
jgi:hypothetical protein